MSSLQSDMMFLTCNSILWFCYPERLTRDLLVGAVGTDLSAAISPISPPLRPCPLSDTRWQEEVGVRGGEPSKSGVGDAGMFT